LNTLSKIAERDDISLSTLKRQIARGEGPVVTQLSPRRVGVTEQDYLDWVARRRRRPVPAQVVTETVSGHEPRVIQP
jgi:hypothetical protein